MESLPTNASPTKSTRCGELVYTSLFRAFIKGRSSCILPAVSTNTTSIFSLLAELIASLQTSAGSFPYPLSYTLISRTLACFLTCSTAPDLKVSHAAIITFKSALTLSLYAIFAILVDLPTPFTPQNTTTYGVKLFGFKSF